jgi:hypothetical protein
MPADYDIAHLGRMSEGYVGAEIEQTVIDAMYIAFNENMRRVTTEDILHCIKTQVPLSVSQRETIAALRTWLSEGRAQSASSQVSLPSGQKPLALEKIDHAHLRTP